MFSACVKKPVPLVAYHSAVPVFNGCLSLVVVVAVKSYLVRAEMIASEL